MSKFVFEAECVEDVCAFLMGLSSKYRIKSFQFSQGEFFSGLEGEVDVDGKLSDLVELALQVDDGHAIVESLSEKGDNSGSALLL